MEQHLKTTGPDQSDAFTNAETEVDDPGLACEMNQGEGRETVDSG